MGNALRWRRTGAGSGRGAPARPAPPPPRAAGHGSGPWSEAQARELLTAAGVPVVPGGLASSADEAVEIASRVGPAGRAEDLLGADHPQVGHRRRRPRAELATAEVRAAYEKVRAAGDAVAGARVDGVLVTPMRSGGTELLAGRDRRPDLRPGARGRPGRRLGRDPARHQPAGAAGRRRRGEAHAGRAARAAAAAGRARRPARRPGRAGRGRSPGRRGRAVARTARCARWKSTRCG